MDQLTEAEFWDRCDADANRQAGWLAAANFGAWAFERMAGAHYPDVDTMIHEHIDVPEGEPVRGLVLGCGDMAGEHFIFTHPRLPFDKVDAYDVSPKSIERAKALTDSKGLDVDYHLADVNEVELEPDRYALVIVYHSFHHFERIAHVAEQINRSLLPGGVFYTGDYVGPCRLQFSPSQLDFAQKMLELMPERYRQEADGSVRQIVRATPPEGLSPDEAAHSDEILPQMEKHLAVRWQYNWGGLLYPLLDGIAANFSDRPEDEALARLLFDLDYGLCATGQIEPNFTLTLATKR